MTRLFFICFLLFGLSSHFVFSQLTISGFIYDKETNEGLPYVNIGILNKGIGTVSLESGYFYLEIPEKYANETLRFSMIGFETINLNPSSAEEKFLLDEKLFMTSVITELNEVVVVSRKWKEKKLGNKTTSKVITVGFPFNALGNEVGMLIPIKKETYIEKIRIAIARNDYYSINFRVNVYSQNEELLPGDNLLNENLVVNFSETIGFLEIDMAKYNLLVEDNVFVSIEWIEDLGSEGLLFSGGVLGKAIYARSTSQASWEKISGLSMGIMVTVKELVSKK